MIPDNRNTRSRPPVKPWVRNRRILLVAFLGITAGIILFIGVTNYLNTRRYAFLLESIRAEGAPATVAELQQLRDKEDTGLPAETLALNHEVTASDDDDQTAVGVFLEAADLLKGLSGNALHEAINEMLKEPGNLSQEDLNKLQSYLEEHGPLLQLLHEAADLPPGRFPLDYSKGYAMELPHLAGIRNAARLLRAEAIYAAMTGNTDLAYEALVTCLAVQRPIRGEGLIISELVDAACNTIGLEGLRDTLALAEYSDEQLADLQSRFNAAHNPAGLTNAFIAERVFALETFKDPAAAMASLDSWLDDFIPGTTTVLIRTADAFGWFAGDRQEYLESIEEMIAASRIPYTESRDIYTNIHEQTINRPISSLYSSLIGGITRVPSVMAANDARLNQGSAAAAIERYRLATGAPPEQWNVLIPDYLDKPPEDPFDQQPLRYRREGDGYLIYSIGANGVDDGGTSAESSWEGDIVFSMQR